jgi:predicted DNA-binding protein YlxM (UPF0122 family)
MNELKTVADIDAAYERMNAIFDSLPESAQEAVLESSANSFFERWFNLDNTKMVNYYKKRLEAAKEGKVLRELISEMQDTINDMKALVKPNVSNIKTKLETVIRSVVAAGLFIIPFVGIASMTAWLVSRKKVLDKVKEKTKKMLPDLENLLATAKTKLKSIAK